MPYEFLFEQEKIDLLCQDRELITQEHHTPNDFYGHASVLKELIGLPQMYSLKFVLAHGVKFSDRFWDINLQAKLPIFALPSVHDRERYRQRGEYPQERKSSVAIGFGFLYAIQLFHRKYGELSLRSQRKGTIAFPSHSTHYVTAKFDFQKYIEHLKGLSEEYQPIVVCIYWKDFLLGHHLEYLNSGFKVVTAGHMFDPLFWIRLYDICRQFKYATSNDLGSHICITEKSGCTFFYEGVGEVNHKNSLESYDFYLDDGFLEAKRSSMELFSKGKIEDKKARDTFINKYIGASSTRSRYYLIALVIYSEILYQINYGMLRKISTRLIGLKQKIKDRFTRA